MSSNPLWDMHPEWFEAPNKRPPPQQRNVEATITGILAALDFLMGRAKSQSAEALAAEIAPPIAEHVEAKVRPLQERIDGLEAELMEMRRAIARQAAVHVEDSER